MKDLISIIDEVIQFGIQPNLRNNDNEKLLERNLVKIYDLFFDIHYEFDETEYSDFDKSVLPDIRLNIEHNFKDFGLYSTFFEMGINTNLKDCLTGDAFDDLTDIIIDLLEIKWRIENNSLADGLWFFEITFHSHTQQHILNLLNYLKRKKTNPKNAVF